MAKSTSIPSTGTLVSQLVTFAERQADALYCSLWTGGRRHDVSYSGLYRSALKCADLLRNNGVVKNDVVLIFLPTQPEMYAAFVGALLVGAIPSYMPGPSVKQDVQRFWCNHRELVTRIAPAAIVTDATLAPDMLQHLDISAAPPILLISDANTEMDASRIVRARDHDIAFLQHSSGTTGLKKGVAITHAALRHQLNSYARAIELSRHDVIATWLPVYHDMGLITSTLMPMMMGLSIHALDPFEWTANPQSLLNLMSSESATLTWMPNFAFEHLVRSSPVCGQALRLQHVRAFINCSEVCFPDTFARFSEHFRAAGVRRDQLQVCYAMAETVFAVSQTRIGDTVAEMRVDSKTMRTHRRAIEGTQDCDITPLLSNGSLIDGLNVVIADEAGNALGEGEIGEVTVSGDCVFSGYFNQPDITRQRLRDGRYYTRDRGFVLDGELFLLGRLDDLIIVHGKNFHASEIEAAVNRVDGIKPGRVTAVPHQNALTGSAEVVITAETAVTEGTALATLKRAVKSAVFQDLALSVHRVSLVAPGTLHKTTSGKISREAATVVAAAHAHSET